LTNVYQKKEKEFVHEANNQPRRYLYKWKKSANNMIKKIKLKTAVNTMLVVLSFFMIFHLFILFGGIPFNIVWGGRLQSTSQMYFFEAVSITVNLIVIVVTAIKGRYINQFLGKRIINFILWILVLLFSLNTLGNLLSKTMLESILFTPFTLISAILCYRMAIEK